MPNVNVALTAHPSAGVKQYSITIQGDFVTFDASNHGSISLASPGTYPVRFIFSGDVGESLSLTGVVNGRALNIIIPSHIPPGPPLDVGFGSSYLTV